MQRPVLIASLVVTSVSLPSIAVCANDSSPLPDADTGPEEPSDSSAPRAKDHGARGFEHGLRLGIAVPFGQSSGGRDFNDEVSFRVPVWLDIGYRVSEPLYFGLYAQAGLDHAPDDHCLRVARRSSVACDADDIRVGLEALFNPLPRGPLDFWVGAGIAWERFRQGARFLVPTIDRDGNEGEAAVEIEEVQSGPVLDLQAGLDFEIDGAFEAGPFVGYTMGMFLTRSFECPDTTCGRDGSIDDKALHHWAALGVRGTFGP